MENIENQEVTEVGLSDIISSRWNDFKYWFNDLDIVVGIKDIINFHRFKKEFDEEEQERESEYNKFNLKRNKLKNIIYCQWNFSDTDLMYADYDTNKMYITKFKKIYKYISDTMGWVEYIDTDVSNFTDENGDPSLSYVFMFRFVPKVFNFRSVFKWVGIILGVGAAVAFLIWSYMQLI